MKYIKKFENMFNINKNYISDSTKDKMKTFNNKTINTKLVFSNKIIKRLGDELSKYLKVKELTDFKIYSYGTPEPIIVDKVYLIDDDFGCVLVPNKMNYEGVSVYTVYKLGKKYIFSKFGSANSQIEFFYNTGVSGELGRDVTSDKDVEIFIKNIVDKLKIKNVIRIKNKNKRELKSSAKKYNL